MKGKLVLVVLLAAVLLVLPAAAFGFGGAYFRVLGAAAFFAAVVLAVSFQYYKRRREADDKRLEIMRKDHDLERFIALELAAARSARNKREKSALCLNLAAGYINNDQPEKAAELLKSLPEKGVCIASMSQTFQAVYHYNYMFALCMEKNPDREEFDREYGDAQIFLIPLRADRRFTRIICNIEILTAIRRENYGTAQALMKQVDFTPDNPDARNITDWMKAQVLMHGGVPEEAESLLRGILDRRPYPVIERITKEALEECYV